jgi:DNA-binding SARP family transcriptional activator/tetratricopeptide (TPR) repeat protein
MAGSAVIEPTTGVRFGVLGPLQVVDGSGVTRVVSAPKQRIVLAALLLADGRTVSAASLAEVLWDASPPPNAPSVTRTYVGRLRRAVGPVSARIAGRPTGWAVELHTPEEFDVAEADGLWRAARAAAGAEEWRQASSLLSRALGLWRGEPLTDIPSPPLARREADRLAELRLQLTEFRIDADLHLGRHSELVAELRRLAAEHPLREHIRAQLMLACYRCGHQAAALEVYRDARGTLAEELGVEPGDELREMHQRVLCADPHLTATAGAVSTVDGLTSHTPQPLAGYRHGLPPDIASLVGRDTEVAVLATGQAGAHAVRVISGMPGVGKTALAVHAAHLLTPEFPDRQIFIDLHGHTPGKNPVSPTAALAELLTAVGVDASFMPADLAARTAMWRDRMSGQRALLVLDNAASSAQVAPLLPGGDCLVMVTSRRQLADLPGAVTGVRLVTLSRTTARTMFVQLTPRAARDDRAYVDELTALAGHLPLAISLLARMHACHPCWTVADLIAEARHGMLGLTAERASVGTAFGLSWRHLTPGQRRLLALLSLHPGTACETHAAAALAGVPITEAARQLDRLHRECLLVEISYRRYRMHDLIRSYAFAQARAMFADEEAAAAVRRLLRYYANAAADDNLAWQRAERANLIGCIEYAVAASWSPEVVALTTAIAGLLRRDGPWPQAERLHAAAVEAAGKLTDRAALARCLLDLATARRLNTDYRRASADLDIALDLFRALGDQVAEAAVLLELSYLRTFTGDFEAAGAFADQALRIYRAAGDRPGQARALTIAGNIWRRTADFPDARQALTEAVAICRELGDRAGLAFALRHLGDVSRLTSDFTAAEAYLSESVELARTVDDRHAEAMGLAWLGNVRWRIGESEAAVRNLERALVLQHDLGNRLGQANAFTLLGNVRHSAGDHAAAIGDLKQALRLHRDAGSSAGEAATLALLGSALAAIGDYHAASSDLRAAIGIFRESGDRYGEAESLTLLAKLHVTRTEIATARLLYQQALDLARQMTSPWAEAHALAGLGRCAHADGNTQHAISQLTRAYEIFHQIGAAETGRVAAERDAIAGQATPQQSG